LTDFGPHEILFSDHPDIIGTDTLMGFAAVEEHCKNPKAVDHSCWNKKYSIVTGKITECRPTKRRRVGETGLG
jgi:hypothetical protein